MLCLIVSVGLVSAQGGYFPTSWGWSTLIPLAVLGFAGVFGATSDFGYLDLALVGALAAFTAWLALSVTWSTSSDGTVLEVERALVSLAVVSAFLVVVRRRHLTLVAAALHVGVTVVCTYALATRLFPMHIGSIDAFAGYRLAEPVGYWNGLSIFAVLGAILAIGLSLSARGNLLLGIWAACSLVVLLPTMYFTFSRGGWIALGVGLVAWLAAAPDRFVSLARVAAIALAPAVGVVLAARSDALTHTVGRLAAAETAGERLALWLLLLIVAQALVAAALTYVLATERRTEQPFRWTGIAIAAVLSIAALGAVFSAGGPAHVVRQGYDSFLKQPAPIRTDLNNRLFTLSGNGRADLWHVAWQMRDAHPLVGAGAGTFERYWLRSDRASFQARDAHNLYLETLAETGPLGLLILVSLLAVPVVAIIRRRNAVTAAAFGAFVAFAAHATIDWDWELTGVTASALLCAAIVVVGARDARRSRPLPSALRAVAVTAASLLFVVAAVAWIGNVALARAVTARDEGRYADAIAKADLAHRWQPWSARPRVIAGEAALLAGDAPQARLLLRRALNDDSGDWETWLALSRVTQGASSRAALARAARLNRIDPSVAALVNSQPKQGGTP
jgi:O-antigen ligase